MLQKSEVKRIDVAVGVLISHTGQFLLTSRPTGKPMEGYWEFPGGKIEPGETVEEALRRELMEELGVEIGCAHLWKETQHDYPHALVRLHWCKVYDWEGDLLMREMQHYAWQNFPLTVTPVLPGAYPILDWLASEGVGGCSQE